MSGSAALMLEPHSIAYEHVLGDGPCVIFCPGFKSSMQGNKARALKAFCQTHKQAFIRFDYRGHGDSGGHFNDSNISTWLADTLSVIDYALIHHSSVILVGSSMGGWLSLLATLRQPTKVSALLLIACAADMTAYYPSRVKGLESKVDEYGQEYYLVENTYDDEQDYSIYRHLIDDGVQHHLLSESIGIRCPVRLVHGDEDEVVDIQRSFAVLSKLESNNASLLTIKAGDHRLSTDADLSMILSCLSELISIINAAK